jgi:adenylate cyclase
MTLDHPVIRWLLTDARRLTESGAFLQAFAERLLDAGVDVQRITTGVPILHPQIVSFSGLWEAGKGVSERLYRHVDNPISALSTSPILVAYKGGSVRCRLTDPAKPDEFSILPELRAEGLTDYVVLSVPFADGSHKALTLATARPAGFSETDIDLFAGLVPALAVNLEVQALRRTARTLLDTYVGSQSGSRVLEGQIRRGMGETIRAVIWLCDLRGFTSLSEALPRDTLIDLLNGYFGPMCDAVIANEGEVLKFIGDAMLAIFPVEDDPARACHQALAAATKAQAEIAEENGWRLQSGAPQIAYGIALHLGDVMYGNIGSSSRLDFTAIGPAVNLTARIESLSSTLGRPLLMSSDFVQASGLAAQALGEFSLKGVGAKQEIFAPTL